MMKIPDTQEVQIGRVVPFIGKRRSDRGFAKKEHLNPRAVMGEVREADDHHLPYPQRFLHHGIEFPDLLQTLVEDHIIKRLVAVIGQAVIDVFVKDAQPAGYALVNGLFIDFDSLGSDSLLAYEQIVNR